ncbi:helix-turn-helix domain-containing protein [Enterococcus alishanensis]|uniref:Helix-turn-helix domain-containing protein n=1 Tax=Enterococcus alishanensis TaxID=1303817 RepID=A0ABS6TFE1_9ENTE|nr:helix-turn-helix domain-containing protein [Enterococcus alishanensis]
MNIGEKIKQQRLQKEWTQEHLAELLNVSRSAVSSWEVGRNYPDLVTIVAISDLFGISLDQLLREDKEMAKNVSKKIKMNKVYKIILGVLTFLIVVYVGLNLKLRVDENRYKENLVSNNWSAVVDGQTARWIPQYELKENGLYFWTQVFPISTFTLPSSYTNLDIIVRNDTKHLVAQINNDKDIELTIAKDNDTSAKYSGKVIVDKDLNVLEINGSYSQAKQKYLKAYVKEHQTDYKNILTQGITKRNQIIE